MAEENIIWKQTIAVLKDAWEVVLRIAKCVIRKLFYSSEEE